MFTKTDKAVLTIQLSGTSAPFLQISKLINEATELNFSSIRVELAAVSLDETTDVFRKLKAILDRSKAIYLEIPRHIAARTPEEATYPQTLSVGYRSIAQFESDLVCGLHHQATILIDPDIAPRHAANVLSKHPNARLDLSNARPDFLQRVLHESRGGRIRVKDEVLTAEGIRRHPCLVHRTPPALCHLRRICPPRRLSIDPTGSVSPYGLGEQYTIGQLTSSTLSEILHDWRDSPGGSNYAALTTEALSSNVLTGLVSVFSTEALLRHADRIASCS